MANYFDKRNYRERLKDTFQEIWLPVRKNRRKILLGVILVTMVLSIGGMFRLDVSFSMLPAVMLASFLLVLQMLIGFSCLMLFFPAKVTQEVCDDWLTDKWSSRHYRRHPDSTSCLTPGWLGYLSLIPGICFFLICVIPMALIAIKLPALISFIGLVNEDTLKWLMEEILPGYT